MQNSNRKFFETLISKTKIYLVIILILLIILSVQNHIMILPSIIVFVAVVIYSYYTNNRRKSEISETLQDLTLTVDSAAKTSLINSPFPLIIIETDGNIIWKSSKFNIEFMNTDINSYLNDLVIDIKEEIESRENKKERTIIRHIELSNKYYEIVGKFVHSKHHENKNNDIYI